VYDIIEGFYHFCTEGRPTTPVNAASDFEQSMNDFFREEEIGWKLVDGRVVSRGSEDFEAGIERAVVALQEVGYQTAKSEIHQAIVDLSRRPEPDLTGAIQHAMAAMECVAREYCNDPQPTFGKLIGRYPDMLP